MKVFTALLFLCFTAEASLEFRVVTYNIRYAKKGETGINAWENRREAVVKYLTETAPDLLGLQEVMLEQRSYLENQLSDYSSYGVDAMGGKSWVQNVLFYRKSRFHQIEKGSFWLSQTPEVAGSKSWDSAQPRLVSWVKLRDLEAQKELLFLNSHFDHIGKTARLESAKLILEKIPEITGKQTLSVIVTGDFNTRFNSKPYLQLTNATPFSLSDAHYHSLELHTGGDCTYNGFEKIYPGRKVDYIFFQNLTVLRHAIDDPRVEGHFASDHMPVRSDLEFID